jgi:hypothetical protein
MSHRRLLPVGLIVLVALLPLGPVPVQAQEVLPPAGPEQGGGLFGVLPDPREWAVTVFTQAIVTILRSVAELPRTVIAAVMGSSLNFVSQTPPAGSYDSPAVKAVWEVTRSVANLGLVLVALWGGFNLIVREHLGEPYHEAMELFPRLVVGALLVNTSLAWTRLLIDLNNALCGAVGGATLPAWERAGGGAQLLANVIAGLAYLITALVLLIQMLMRLAFVDVLLAVSPLALLCWVLPQTQSYARAWSNAFVAAVFTQFLQVLTLRLGGALVSDLTPASKDAEALGLFLGVAVLAFTLKVPGLMRTHAGDGLGLARYLVYRQVGDRLSGGREGGGRGKQKEKK